MADEDEVRISALTPEERQDRDRLFEVVRSAAGTIAHAKVEAGIALIEIRERALWLDDFDTFELFLTTYCGNKSTGYDWMHAATVAAQFPDEAWLAERPSTSAELYKLRDNPELQAQVVQAARSARIADVKRVVREIASDEAQRDLFAADPEMRDPLGRLSKTAEQILFSRAERNQPPSGVSVPVITPAAIIKIRDARDRLRDAVRLAADLSPTDSQRAKALTLIGETQIELSGLRKLFAVKSNTDEDDESVDDPS